MIENVLTQSAPMITRYRIVFDESRRMADPVGSTVLDRLPNRGEAKCFTGMNRDIEVFFPEKLKCLIMVCWRMT